MTVKAKTAFFCKSCGFESTKWAGKCPGCQEWNTLIEEKFSKPKGKERGGFQTLAQDAPVHLSEVSLESYPRVPTHSQELNRVLGGGITPGTLILLGGDPGIGKSTLVLELASSLAESGQNIFYVSGEESKEQIRMRSDRLTLKSDFWVLCENNLDLILKSVEELKPQLLVLDSIQTVFMPELESAPGSVSQVRECTARLLYFAKKTQTTIVLIGHVNKDGMIAGPKVLEHMVDTVLSFEGESTGQFRILRAIKNRYGNVSELGVFEMTAQGLKDVLNPSQLFLSDRSQEKTGSIVTTTLEGTRALLTEIQALVAASGLPQPRRTGIGVDSYRMSLVIAVLEKSGNQKFYDRDVFVSAAGGLRINDPSADLAILLALYSSLRDIPLSGRLAGIGEVGLNGEIRRVSEIQKRVTECAKLGYTKIILPHKQIDQVEAQKGVELISAKDIGEALRYFK